MNVNMLQAQLSSSRVELQRTQRDAQEARQAQQEAQSALAASKGRLADAGKTYCILNGDSCGTRDFTLLAFHIPKDIGDTLIDAG